MRAHSRARARGCEWGLRGGGEGTERGGGGARCFSVRVCMCVCVCVWVGVHGRYLEGLTVGGERERESSLCL